MLSKQATAETACNNKAVTSKNKPSHRKRKNEKLKKAENAKLKTGKAQEQLAPAAPKSLDECDKAVTPDLIEDLKRNDVHANGGGGGSPQQDHGTECDVVLRRKDDGGEKHTINVKRYSDSFVIDSSAGEDLDHGLSRAHSGFFYPNSSDACDPVKEKKPRRFSDILFRHGSVKTSSARCDNAADGDKMVTELDISDSGKVIVRSASMFKEPKSVKRTPSITRQDNVKVAKVKHELAAAPPPTNSVLKRVRSKIYSKKSENGVSAVPSMPDISECKEKKNKNKKNAAVKADAIKVPNNNFLIRQTSNLERIRPMSTFGQKKTHSVDAEVVEKPVLAKSKSSSAINLSLWKTKTKILLTQKNKSNQEEYDYEDFGGINNNYLNRNVRKFGSQDLSNINNNNNNFPTHVRQYSWIGNYYKGDTKPGNPVTRTPSDRRPDAVREESSRSQTAHSQSQSNEAEAANTECTASLPASTGNKKKQNSNINRSESVKEQSEKNRKQRRNISDPTHINDRSELDNISAFHQQSGNSSNSCSSSSVSSESPSSSLDPAGALSDGQCQKDSDMEVDVDPPNWKSALTEDQLRALQSHETTRQDVINEFFHTERSHLRNLKILNNVFRPEVSKVLTEDEMHLIFSNLRELVDVHNKFNSSMRERWLQKPIVMEVGDILLTMFDDELGNTLCAAASNFCGRQQIALDFIKEKRKKDTKFDSTLALCERNKSCRRLTLQDFLPQEMQRLAKYPLLIERLIDTEEESCRINAGKSTAELDKMKVALEKSRNILDKINEATKRFVSKHRLEEINAHLDNSLNDRIDSGFANEYRNFSLTRYTLIYDSTVTLKRAGKTPLQVHMILSEEAVILLQKESERYLLKFFHSNQATLQPIIRIQNVICRKNAADTHTLYLLSIHSNQMYEIQCPDANERKLWFKYLTDATEPYKSRSERNKKTQDHDDDAAVQALAMARSDAGERSDAVAAAGAATGTDDLDVPSSSSSTIGGGEQPNSQRNSDIVDDDATEKRLSLPEDVPVLQTAGNGVLEKVAANDWPLIQPSEVQVAIPPVHTAEPVLTPLEQIKRKDEEVRQALADKEVLVADLLSIPRDAYHHIADIASDESIQKTPSDREPSELVLAAVYQVSQLTAAVNESLNISETEHMAALGGKYPSCASNESSMIANNVPSVPTSKLQTIAATLNSQLTQLLSLVKQRDEERDILRRELYRTREQLHEKMNLHGSMVVDRNESIQLECTQSGDLESIEQNVKNIRERQKSRRVRRRLKPLE